MSELLRKRLELQDEIKRVTTDPVRRAVAKRHLAQIERDLSRTKMEDLDKVLDKQFKVN